MPLPIRNKKWNSEQTGHYKELLPYPKQSTLAQNRKKRLSRPSFCQKFARDIRKRTTTKILGGYDHWSQFTKPNFLPQIGNAIVIQTISPQSYHQNNATLPQPSNIHAPVHILTNRELKKERKKEMLQSLPRVFNHIHCSFRQVSLILLPGVTPGI